MTAAAAANASIADEMAAAKQIQKGPEIAFLPKTLPLKPFTCLLFLVGSLDGIAWNKGCQGIMLKMKCQNKVPEKMMLKIPPVENPWKDCQMHKKSTSEAIDTEGKEITDRRTVEAGKM
jgi:hypothetical protein